MEAGVEVVSKEIRECERAEAVRSMSGGRWGRAEGHPRPTNDGGSHREKERGSKEGVGIQRSGKRGARWDGYRPDRVALEKWSEPE